MSDISFLYNKRDKQYQTTKVNKETTYYLGVAKICPRCKNYIQGYPALSRKDNKTEICSNCGKLEALEVFEKYQREVKDENRNNN